MNRKKWIGFDAFDALLAEAEVEVEPVEDNVVDLNANVVELTPPDDAA